MHTFREIAIIGTGAVGGYYGALLQQAGFKVHFLLHRDYEHVRHHGLWVESPNGDIHLPTVNAYDDPQKMPRCDGVVIALKTTANRVLKKILPQVLKDDGLVLTLQNGLGSEEEIASLVGEGRVIGGLCFLCANKVAPGHIRHVDYGLITLGEYRADGRPGGITPRLEQLGSDMQSASIEIQLIEDLLLARWKKLVWNIPFNGLSVVRNTLTDELVRNPEIRTLCSTLMDEVAAASIRPIPQDFIEHMMVRTEKMVSYAPSMKLDFDRSNPMEIESIYGNPLRAAKARGIAMPETEKLYHQLLELEPMP